MTARDLSEIHDGRPPTRSETLFALSFTLAAAMLLAISIAYVCGAWCG